MDNTFLSIVAQDIVERYGTDLTRIAVVFPNKRAALFFNRHLYRAAGKPVWAPTYITISELFHADSPFMQADPILSVVELYAVYSEVTGKDETLDQFFEWGKLLVGDFDDVDKNMANPTELFANIANIHEFDSADYLTDNQRETLKRFFANFSEDHNSQLKETFLTLWNKLGDIYNAYRLRLSQKGIAYEGMLYRDAIENNRIKVDKEKYIFVGFNLLQKVELSLFRMLKEEGKAEFYWDFDTFYCNPSAKKQQREAGKYIAQYISLLGNQMPANMFQKAYCNFNKPKSVEFVRAKTENVQARHVAQWLRTEKRYAQSSRTAIVMCDETLLLPVLYSLPAAEGEEYDVNITAGYPLAQTPVASFVTQLLDMQTTGRRADGGFRYKVVKSLLLHPYSTLAAASAPSLLEQLESKHIYFPSQADLALDSDLELLFQQPTTNTELMKWLVEVLRNVAPHCESEFYQEAVFCTYTIVNRLQTLVSEGQLDVDRTTLQKLLKQIIATSSIPFHGEPAKGIQIMGVLETRNLDFDHLLILSCNEGNMPKGIRDSSFIPYALRKAYGLTTVDNKVAIYAYYFFRLVQRAKDITVVYNTATENGNRGEMSRFMLQMLVETDFNIRRTTLQTGQDAVLPSMTEVEKTGRMMATLRQMSSAEHPLSPTALNMYMACPMKFYYNYMAGIKEPDDDAEEELSLRAFGNIFHNTMEQLYKPYAGTGRTITASLIERLAEKHNVEATVDRMFIREIYGKDANPVRKIHYTGMQLLSRRVIIKYVERMLKLDMRQAPLDIVSVEGNVKRTVCVETPEGKIDVVVGGRVDRIDTLTDRQSGMRIMRVVDYKTGSSDVRVAPKNVETVYRANADERAKGHTDYYFQAMLYSDIIRGNNGSGAHPFNPQALPVAPALVFIQKAAANDYDPVLFMGTERMTDIAEYSASYNELLRELLSELFDMNTPFRRTNDAGACKFCPYVGFCGR